MALLIFSNNNKPDQMDNGNVIFQGYISDNDVKRKGIIKNVQEFIRDDNILDNKFEDEHLGLILMEVENEYYYSLSEILDQHELVLWSTENPYPNYYVEVPTDKGYFLYVVYIVH